MKRRIDVQTLVLAFEKRIEELEKNPPDKVPTSVVINLLEKAIDEVMRDHFIQLTKIELKDLVQTEFNEHFTGFCYDIVNEILKDEHLKETITKTIKNRIIVNI